MKKHLLPLFTVMAAFAMFGCNNTKVPATEKKTGESVVETAPAETAAPADAQEVAGTKTVKLSNGASVIMTSVDEPFACHDGTSRISPVAGSQSSGVRPTARNEIGSMMRFADWFAKKYTSTFPNARWP